MHQPHVNRAILDHIDADFSFICAQDFRSACSFFSLFGFTIQDNIWHTDITFIFSYLSIHKFRQSQNGNSGSFLLLLVLIWIFQLFFNGFSNHFSRSILRFWPFFYCFILFTKHFDLNENQDSNHLSDANFVLTELNSELEFYHFNEKFISIVKTLIKIKISNKNV